MMKKIWLLVILGFILAGCGGESKYDSFLEAQQRRRTTKVFFDYETQLKKDKATLAQLQEKEKSDDAKESAKATERIKYLKMQIAHIEETILLRSLTDYESPEMTEKAVYVDVKILYLCLPQEVRKEFLALAADSSIWNSKDRTGVGNYPNAMKYMNKEETKQKRSEMAEKYGLKLVKNQIYYTSPELLDKAYEAMKKIPFEE